MVRRIEKVAVIGSGIMGGGIAALCASAGIPTLLLDIVPFDLKEEEKNNPAARNRIVKAGLDNTVKAKPGLFMDKNFDVNLIEIGNLTDDFDKLKDCDLIVEVVVENLKIKQDLFARIEKIRKPSAIISSNTSGLPLAKMAEGRSADFKKHFLITHFFNPVRYMKLLELVAGPDTDKEVCEFISNWGEKILGKGIVWAKDTPNFIGNRIGVAMICEAVKLLEKSDVSIPTIDAIFGSPMGIPKTGVFALTDLVGLDTVGHLSENSYELLPNDEYREVYKLPAFVKGMLEKKMFGNKTKDAGGFYKTTIDPKTWKRNKMVLDIKTLEHVAYDSKALPECVVKAKVAKTLAEKQKAVLFAGGKESDFAWKLIARLLTYTANRIPEIADTVVGVDNALKWGYAWETGPFEIWDNIGLKDSVKKMEADGFAVPANIKKMIDSGNDKFYKVEKGKEMFYDFASNSYKPVPLKSSMIFLKTLRADNKVVKSNDAASLIDIGDGVFCMEFHSKMNAVNKAMVEFMGEAREYVEKNGIGMVIGNQAPGIPGAFCAGGDLGFMGGLAKDGKFSEIEAFIALVHKNVMGTKYAPFPVVAAPYGMTLGGGAEVCLAADKIVAHCELYMGLVEIGAGLLPAGGGCTNLWRKFVESVPGPVKVTDMAAYFIPCFQNIAMAKVSMSAAEARKNGFLGPKDRIVYNKDFLIGEAKKEVLKMVDDGYVPPIKTKIPVMGGEAMGMIHAELFNMKNGGYITPHMEFIAKRIAYVLSGGEARSGLSVSEDYMLKLEREAFVDLWKTENSQKMAAHILTTGKPLMI
ncbi:MAG: 3-hydroxyacyl-CoA dehydrogenase/enoyl-CoA hydratase family protein [Spirochaetes bacterium]|jgi:3-hydroxyacyl-CoA dehydrogenase|nr:3-hydroxyacyl-CoA dehydrogenase/enoyl-CoA hydratase family protein [Spirochaetota bacterium]